MSKKAFIAMMVGVALLVPTFVMAGAVPHQRPESNKELMAVLSAMAATGEMDETTALFEGQTAIYTGDELVRYGNIVQTSEDWLMTGTGYYDKAADLLSIGEFDGARRLFVRAYNIFHMLQANHPGS